MFKKMHLRHNLLVEDVQYQFLRSFERIQYYNSDLDLYIPFFQYSRSFFCSNPSFPSIKHLPSFSDTTFYRLAWTFINTVSSISFRYCQLVFDGCMRLKFYLIKLEQVSYNRHEQLLNICYNIQQFNNTFKFLLMNASPSFSDFTTLSVIGKGTYAKVLLVRYLKDSQLYALKVLKKKYILQQKQEKHIMTEKQILAGIQHPFLVKLRLSFQDQKKLYFLLEYCPGGELFSLLQAKDKLTQDQAKFYCAQIILALQTLHKSKVIYRDLKPENIIIDRAGYIKLTDFGLSKILQKEQNAHSVCGTPEYLAPQIIKKAGHGVDVDWWCLGCLLHQMVTGFPPFHNDNRMLLFESIVYKNPDLSKFPPKLQDILRKLLVKDPTNRLGHKSVAQIKSHPWFQKLNWQSVQNKKIKAPFIPKLSSDVDITNFGQQFTSCSIESTGEKSPNQQIIDKFKDFSFE